MEDAFIVAIAVLIVISIIYTLSCCADKSREMTNESFSKRGHQPMRTTVRPSRRPPTEMFTQTPWSIGAGVPGTKVGRSQSGARRL
jgi:hypothetical protein